VAGLHDPAPPIATARDYASRITGARLVELPAAHLSNVEAAQEFNAAVLRFLNSE
jgi:3-oxoadipate enol-lactonase